MALSAVKVWVQLFTSSWTWTDISADVMSSDGISIRYGINGFAPTDCVADSGVCEFTLNNSAGNASGKQGRYSPLHANQLPGWGYDVACKVACCDSVDAVISVSSITHSGTTATATTATPHGRTTGDWVLIAGVTNGNSYNGAFPITVTGASTFTYVGVAGIGPPAAGTITCQRTYVKHRGRVYNISVESGKYESQRVRVTSYDAMRKIADADVREVAIQQNKTEAELITAVLNTLSVDEDPVTTDIDAGVDSFPYAFHDLGAESKAIGAIQRAAQASYGMVAIKGDGTLIFRSRHTRARSTSLYTFNDDALSAFEAPNSLDAVYNLVRVTIHPPSIDAAATTVLYRDTGTGRVLEAGATTVLWVSFRDPNESRTLIGAINVVKPLVANTDFGANAQADGLGADLSAQLTVTFAPFATKAKITLTNTSAQTMYLVDGAGAALLQVRGQGIYDLGPQTYASDTSTIVAKPITIDLSYQDDPQVAQSYADYIFSQRQSIIAQPRSIEFDANSTAALTTIALQLEPGDAITVSETVTGFSAVKAIVASVSLTISGALWMTCAYGLIPAEPFSAWQLGTAGASELGSTTVLGF